MRKLFLFAALCCAIMANAAKFNDLKTIQTGGVERQYFLYVPNNLADNSPLIISCHGMNQDYQYQKEQTQWPLMADTASFVVAYPVGVAGSVWGTDYTTGWNIDDMTDVNFMLDIVSDVKSNYNIDETRVYMSGFSLGAVFTYYVAKKAAGSFAAFAPISGYDLVDKTATSSRPVPIIHVHGDHDDVMSYNHELEAYIRNWALKDNCNMTPIAGGEGGANSSRYTNGNCETEVILFSVFGRGHIPTNEGFHTSKAIWNFCKQYSTACGKISTSLNQTNQQSTINNQKLIKDGQLFIQRGDELFNASGARIE